MRLLCAAMFALLVTPALAAPDEYKDVPADLAKAAIAYDNAQLEKDGMSVVRKVDGQAFRDALVPAYAAYSKEFGADNIRKIQEVK